METVDDLSLVETTEDLSDRYPMAYRSIVRRSAEWILVYLTVLLGIILLLAALPIAPDSATSEFPYLIFQLVVRVVFWSGFILVTGKLLYELFCHLMHHYVIELDHLVITNGLILRTRASFPFPRITDVHVQRDFLDLIFGLYNLRILTAGPLGEIANINGLPGRNAVGLQNRILALVETTLPKVDEQAAGGALEQAKESTA